MKKEDFLTMIDRIDFEKVQNFNLTIVRVDQSQININNSFEY